MRTLTTILTIIIFTSCNQQSKNDEQTKTPVKKEVDAKTQTIQTEFGGNWVNKKYVDKLLKTKSPKESQDIAPMTMLMLPKQTNQLATIIWGFHEGTSGTVKELNGKFGIQSGTDAQFELTFKIENNLLKTEKDEFVRIQESTDPNNDDIVEQLLFKGKYELDGQEVEFTHDGRVLGLDSITYYTVLIDYYDAGMQVDQLRLGKDFENSSLYGFEFDQNTLKIYQLDCVTREDDYCVVVQNGQEIFKMIRK